VLNNLRGRRVSHGRYTQYRQKGPRPPLRWHGCPARSWRWTGRRPAPMDGFWHRAIVARAFQRLSRQVQTVIRRGVPLLGHNP
jgi:hypothetical protein